MVRGSVIPKGLRLLRGVGALAVLAALIGGVPWALWHFVGWPLPRHVPGAAQVRRALDHQGIGDQALIDALAVVVWIAWATLVASLVAEVPAALCGRQARRLPVAGVFQPLTGRLVAAIVVGALALAPRPGHPASPTASLGGHSGGLRRPTPALVLSDVTLTRPTSLPGLTNGSRAVASSGLHGASSPAGQPSAAPAPEVYVVQRGDTLWGVAERQLGDPLRWSEIYRLNAGRPQPGGATLTDPHWIDPGWTLLLPATTTPLPGPSEPAASAAPPPTAPPSTPTTAPVPLTPVSPTAPTTPAPAASAPTLPATHGVTPTQRVTSTSAPVRLPSGSMVGGSFVAGVLSAVALGRLRRRHAYRYRPPEPGRNLAPDPLRPTLRHLTVTAAESDGPRPPAAGEVPAMADDDVEHRERPDLVEVGARDGRPVELTLSELGGVSLAGPAASAVVAAWVTALMVRAGPRAAEVVMTRRAREAVFGPGGGPGAVPGLRVLDDPGRVLGVLERVVLSRVRQLVEDDASDVVAYRRANPWEPVPMVLAVVERIPDGDAGRWAAVVDAGSRLGLAAITWDPGASLPARLVVGDDRVVTDGAPIELAARLAAVELFGLSRPEAADVLATLADAEERPDSDPEEALAEPEEEAWPTAPRPPEGTDERASDRPLLAAAAADEAGGDTRPSPGGVASVTVRLFGPYEITVNDQVISRGLRSVAKELLAWLCLRPEGATVEAVVDALWPDTERAQVHKAFWLAAANLRTRLGATSDAGSKVLVASGDIYCLDPAAVDCDLWAFQQALGVTARAEGDRAARDALRKAVDAYRGDLLVGTDYAWVEPVRHDLHRRALDAHLRLAELEVRLELPDAAEDTLRRAIDLDRYAEEPYRQLMALQADRGRPDAIADTWRLLRDRLGEIDVDPEPATERLYHSLTNPPDTPAERARRARQRS